MYCKLTIEATNEIELVNGVLCRRWAGRTPAGDQVDLWVHLIGSSEPRAWVYLNESGLAPMEAPPELPEGRSKPQRPDGG